jgi:hypothetical protein
MTSLSQGAVSAITLDRPTIFIMKTITKITYPAFALLLLACMRKQWLATTTLCMFAGIVPVMAHDQQASANQATIVQVSAMADGGFGTPGIQPFQPLIKAITVHEKSTITVRYISGTWCFGAGLCTGPNGTNFDQGASTAEPLLETIGALGGVITNMAALMGAFVPESLTKTPGFQPVDGTKLTSGVGIMPNMLFFVGSFNAIETSGPGTLYLGINDEGIVDNSGALTVGVEVSCADHRNMK